MIEVKLNQLIENWDNTTSTAIDYLIITNGVNNMIKKNGCLRFNRIDEGLPLNDNYTSNKLDWF